MKKDVEDITERKRMEEKLRESEERFRNLYESIQDPVGVFLGREGRLIDYNKAFKRLSGYTDEELKDKIFLDFVHPDDQAIVLEKYRTRYPEGELPLIYEVRGVNKKGEIIPLEISVSTYKVKGKVVGIEVICRDITERKQAEEKLKEYSERLEEMVEQRTKELRDAQEKLVRKEKLAVLGQLAGGVGHELRNPLGAIKNAAYFLNMALEEPEPEVKETLEILEKEVTTSERIVSSLLDFARPKPPTRRKVDINDVVQEALSRAAVPENVEVVSQLDEALPTILADPDQLGQVFGNIVLNAVQAMPEGGQLAVKSEAPSPKWVAVSFADTGVGIPEEDLGKLFEPLFTTKAKGIGLGLAVVRILIEGHRGTIEVESEVGKGSTFMVKLPMGRGEK